MGKILTTWKRIFVYLFVVVLMAIVGDLGGWIMGLVFGLIFSLLIELYSFIREDTVLSIDKKLVSFHEIVNKHISSLNEFKKLQEQFKSLNIDLDSSALSGLVDLYGTGLVGKLMPTFLIKSSIQPSDVAQDASLSMLLLNSTQSSTLLVRSFDFVKKTYWGIAYTKLDTWDFSSFDDAMEMQSDLVLNKAIDIRRVFIYDKNDSEEKIIEMCKIHREKYHVNCRFISLETIKKKPPLYEAWQRFWRYYLDSGEIGKFVLLSPDFGIVDNEVVISYLLDSRRNHIGAAVYFKPKFIGQLVEYYQHLFEESKIP